MRIVLDTNVLVSGLLSPGGPPGRIIDLITAGRVTGLYDDRIMAEYRDVLARPRLAIPPELAHVVLEQIQLAGLLTPAAPLMLTLPDSDDLPFLEVASAGMAAALITGNQRHYVPMKGSHKLPVMSPAAFLQLWTDVASPPHLEQ